MIYHTIETKYISSILKKTIFHTWHPENLELFPNTRISMKYYGYLWIQSKMTFYIIYLIFYVGADWVSARAVLPNALSPAGTNHYQPWNLWRLLLLRIWEGGRKTNISVIFNWWLQTPDNILQSKIHCIQIASASSLPLFAMASKNISEEDSEPLAWPMWMFPYQTQCATIQQISVWAQQSPKKYLEVFREW